MKGNPETMLSGGCYSSAPELIENRHCWLRSSTLENTDMGLPLNSQKFVEVSQGYHP